MGGWGAQLEAINSLRPIRLNRSFSSGRPLHPVCSLCKLLKLLFFIIIVIYYVHLTLYVVQIHPNLDVFQFRGIFITNYRYPIFCPEGNPLFFTHNIPPARSGKKCYSVCYSECGIPKMRIALNNFFRIVWIKICYWT